jgi:hypothetical protein
VSVPPDSSRDSNTELMAQKEYTMLTGRFDADPQPIVIICEDDILYQPYWNEVYTATSIVHTAMNGYRCFDQECPCHLDTSDTGSDTRCHFDRVCSLGVSRRGVPRTEPNKERKNPMRMHQCQFSTHASCPGCAHCGQRTAPLFDCSSCSAITCDEDAWTWQQDGAHPLDSPDLERTYGDWREHPEWPVYCYECGSRLLG